MVFDNDSDLDDGWLCSHYKRRCYVKFDCCEQFWPCHRCHNNQSTCGQKKLKARDTKMVKCLKCDKVQQFGQFCCKCNTKFANYYCGLCKHLTGEDDSPYHCDKCGICRINRDLKFHCDICGCCFDVRENHKCREGSAHDECCHCREDTFTDFQTLPCSHKIHKNCAVAMNMPQGLIRCPICSRESLAHKLERRPQSNSGQHSHNVDQEVVADNPVAKQSIGGEDVDVQFPIPQDGSSRSYEDVSFSVEQDDSHGRENISLRNVPPTSVATSLYYNYKLLLLTVAQILLSDDVLKLTNWARRAFCIDVSQNATDVLIKLDEKGIINASDLSRLHDFFEDILRIDLVYIIDAFLLGNYSLLHSVRYTPTSRRRYAETNRSETPQVRTASRNIGFPNPVNTSSQGSSNVRQTFVNGVTANASQRGTTSGNSSRRINPAVRERSHGPTLQSSGASRGQPARSAAATAATTTTTSVVNENGAIATSNNHHSQRNQISSNITGQVPSNDSPVVPLLTSSIGGIPPSLSGEESGNAFFGISESLDN